MVVLMAVCLFAKLLVLRFIEERGSKSADDTWNFFPFKVSHYGLMYLSTVVLQYLLAQLRVLYM